MKTVLCLLAAAALLCGCTKVPPPAPASTPQSVAAVPAPPTKVKWEYKIVTLENVAQKLSLDALSEMQTNVTQGLKDVHQAESGAGGFDFAGKLEFYGADLQQLGADGWELVSAVPQIETIPGAQATDLRFSNMRTGKIILIFKKPAE